MGGMKAVVLGCETGEGQQAEDRGRPGRATRVMAKGAGSPIPSPPLVQQAGVGGAIHVTLNVRGDEEH